MLPEDRGRRSRLLRSARLLLDWSQARLACEAGFSTGTVYVVESGRLDHRSPTVLAVVRALQRGGVAFMAAGAGQGHGVRYACDGRRHAERKEAEVTQEEFAERLRQLVGEAEDAGLELRAMIEALREQAQAMQIAYEE
ncbi:MAG: hypothetical protein AB7I59_01655 [Geminicoccaceae bacterium]